MNPSQLHSRLTWCEVDGSLAADCRRVLRDERMTLGLALESQDARRIAAAYTEALRVAEMWGVEVQE